MSHELRDMVLAAAMGLGVQTLEVADERSMTVVSLRETVKAENTEWQLSATYDRARRALRVTGTVQASTADEMLAQVFGSGNGFDFTLPRTWFDAARRTLTEVQ